MDMTTRYICEIPPSHGAVVGMVTFRDKVLIATQYGGVFELQEDFVRDSYHITRVKARYTERGNERFWP